MSSLESNNYSHFCQINEDNGENRHTKEDITITTFKGKELLFFKMLKGIFVNLYENWFKPCYN